MQFGLFIPQGWRHDLVGIDPAQHWGVMAGLARRVDGNPDWSSIWVYDHMHTTPRPAEEATHEAWSLMAAFAGVTGRIRLGQMCTCMGYRNPAHLAKVAATVDVVSEGRLEMGIGAGWYEHEWRAYGYGFPSAGERLKALREGVEIMRQMWTTGRSTYAGELFTTDGALCFPRPLQGDARPGEPRATASRCGSPAVASGRRCASPPSTRTTPTSPRTPRSSPPRARSCVATAPRSAATSTRSSAAPTTTSSSVATRQRSVTGSAGSGTTTRRRVCPRMSSTSRCAVRARPPRRHARADRRGPRRPARRAA